MHISMSAGLKSDMRHAACPMDPPTRSGTCLQLLHLAMHALPSHSSELTCCAAARVRSPPPPHAPTETEGIPAVINNTTTSFSFPTNYPFQSYSARFPVPGTTSNFGDITQNLYYSTIIAGKVRKQTANVGEMSCALMVTLRAAGW